MWRAPVWFMKKIYCNEKKSSRCVWEDLAFTTSEGNMKKKKFTFVL